MLATSEHIERAMGGYTMGGYTMGGDAMGGYTAGVRGEVRTLDYEQVSMPLSSAVQVMLGRAAAARFAAPLAAALRMQHVPEFTRL